MIPQPLSICSEYFVTISVAILQASVVRNKKLRSYKHRFKRRRPKTIPYWLSSERDDNARRLIWLMISRINGHLTVISPEHIVFKFSKQEALL